MSERYLRYLSVLGAMGALWANVYGYHYVLDFGVWSKLGLLGGPVAQALGGTYVIFAVILATAYVVRILIGDAFKHLLTGLWALSLIGVAALLVVLVPPFLSLEATFELGPGQRFALVVASCAVLLVAFARVEFGNGGPFFSESPWWQRVFLASGVAGAAVAFVLSAAVIGYYRSGELEAVDLQTMNMRCEVDEQPTPFTLAFEQGSIRGFRCGRWAALVQDAGPFPGWHYVASGRLIRVGDVGMTFHATSEQLSFSESSGRDLTAE